jgi:nucleotide-binding universal stress UspA family protein
VLGSAHDAAHGRTRLGGTAARVLDGAAGPVAVVPRDHGERTLGAVGVGLLPSAEGRTAMRFGVALAHGAGVPLLVLVVLRRSPGPADAVALAARLAPSAVPAQGSAGEILRAAISAAAREAESALRTAPRAGALAVEPRVLVGDPTDALLRASARVSVLVLGSRGYGPPGVVLAGGAARSVLDGARCPVLLVPRAAAVPVRA